MEFATGSRLSCKKERSRRLVRLRQGYSEQASGCAGNRSLISMEIILRPVLSIFMSTARLAEDTMEASAEALRSICDFHASGGTTSLLLTTATAPLNDNREGLASGSRFSISDQRGCRCSSRRAVHFESESRSATRRVHSESVTDCCAAVARIRRCTEACDAGARAAWSTLKRSKSSVLMGSA